MWASEWAKLYQQELMFVSYILCCLFKMCLHTSSNWYLKLPYEVVGQDMYYHSRLHVQRDNITCSRLYGLSVSNRTWAFDWMFTWFGFTCVQLPGHVVYFRKDNHRKRTEVLKICSHEIWTENIPDSSSRPKKYIWAFESHRKEITISSFLTISSFMGLSLHLFIYSLIQCGPSPSVPGTG